MGPARARDEPDNRSTVEQLKEISGIVAGLSGGFHPAHALQVWPSGDVFTILSGHHRAEGAKRAGLDEVPCWIRDDLTEDEAFMFLVTDNNQGELSPLEIGLHALESVQLGNRWSQNGGLSDYADAIGKKKSTISEYRQAAEVFRSVSDNGKEETIKFGCPNLMDKANHLVAIHKAPSPLWPVLVSALLAKEWHDPHTRGMTTKRNGLSARVALFLCSTSSRVSF